MANKYVSPDDRDHRRAIEARIEEQTHSGMPDPTGLRSRMDLPVAITQLANTLHDVGFIRGFVSDLRDPLASQAMQLWRMQSYARLIPQNHIAAFDEQTVLSRVRAITEKNTDKGRRAKLTLILSGHCTRPFIELDPLERRAFILRQLCRLGHDDHDAG